MPRNADPPKTNAMRALALLDRPFDVYIDYRAVNLDRIFVNGGRRGLNLRLRTQDLISVTGARSVQVR